MRLGDLYIKIKVDTTDLETAKKRIISFTNFFRSAGTAAMKGFSMLGGAIVGGITTMISGVLPILSRGITNITRAVAREINRVISESINASYPLIQAAAIMTQDTVGSAIPMYEKLSAAVITASKDAIILPKQMADLAYHVGIAGGRLGEFQQMLPVISKLAAFSDQNMDTLAMDTLRLMRIFGLTENQVDQLGNALAVAITNSVAKLPDFMHAARYAGATWVNAFGMGVRSMNEFLATHMVLFNRGLRGAMAGRYVRRLIQGLQTPTSRVSALFSRLGIELYKEGKATSNYAETLRKLGIQLHDAYEEHDKLTEQLGKVKPGTKQFEEATQKVSESRLKLQQLEQMINEVFSSFRDAGGELRSMTEVVKEFRDFAVTAGTRSLQWGNLIAKVVGLRGRAAVDSLVHGIDELIKNANLLNRAHGKLESIYTKIGDTAATELKKLKSAWAGVGLALYGAFVEPFVRFGARGIREQVLNPFIKAFVDTGQWINIKHRTEKIAESTLIPLFKDIGKLATITFAPEVAGITPEALPIEREKLQQSIRDKLTAVFTGLSTVFTPILAPLGEFLTTAFTTLIDAEIIKRFFFGLGGDIVNSLFSGISQALLSVPAGRAIAPLLAKMGLVPTEIAEQANRIGEAIGKAQYQWKAHVAPLYPIPAPGLMERYKSEWERMKNIMDEGWRSTEELSQRVAEAFPRVWATSRQNIVELLTLVDELGLKLSETMGQFELAEVGHRRYIGGGTSRFPTAVEPEYPAIVRPKTIYEVRGTLFSELKQAVEESLRLEGAAINVIREVEEIRVQTNRNLLDAVRTLKINADQETENARRELDSIKATIQSRGIYD